MKKNFTVTAVMTQILTTSIEADTLEEAEEMAKTLDGGVFAEEENSGSWNISSVIEE